MAKKLTTVEMNGKVTEVWVEIPPSEPPAWPAGAELSVLGKPLPRVDGAEKAAGRAKYTHDVNLPHMRWMKTLRSPLPHARIRSIDTSAAENVPGVELILTHENVPDIPWHDGSSKLLDPTLRYVGDEVAAVVAVDETAAAEAAALIDVRYEKLPYALSADAAMRPGAPSILEGSNVVGDEPWVYERGDVGKGFAEADHVVEMEFHSPCQMHACLETHASVALWHGPLLTVWDSTQAVHPNRQELAEKLKVPISDVRVICIYGGGGFGSKLWLNKYTVLAALAARRLGKPVKVTLDREEEAHAMGNRPPSVMVVKAGCRKDGTVTALHMKNTGSVGAFVGRAIVGSPLREIYLCPNVRTEETSVLINADPARPHRAPGFVQGSWALEQVLDELASRCGMDPLDFRLKNYSERDQIWGKPFSSKGLREAYEKGADAFGWSTRARRKPKGAGPIKRGFGLATAMWGGAGGPPGYAIVKLYSDGSAMVYSGCQDIGTATRTSMVQIACEELGLPPDKVTCVMGDTQGTPYGFVSGGSRTTPSQAPAVRMAAADVIRQLLDQASAQMKVPASRLELRGGRIVDKENAETAKSMNEVLAEMNFNFDSEGKEQNMIIGTGWRGPNDDEVLVRAWGAQFAEVEVDTDTGEVRVLKIVAAHESGRLLNPLAASSQVEGGVIQGIGFALHEERVLNNASGRIVNANLHDYKIPSALDIPEIEAILVDLPDPKVNNSGVKGLGEPPIIPTAAAIANAVTDAIGVRVPYAPMTPKRVLDALEKGGRRA